MSNRMKLESLKYFETVSRCQKALVCIALFFVFWLVNQMIFSLDFNYKEQLLIGLLFPVAIFYVFFLGYRNSYQVDRADNYLSIKCKLPELIISLNRCGFNLKEQIGDYYLMRSRFSAQCRNQIIVKSEGTGCFILGDVFLIKMLKNDIVEHNQ
jgi:hypothetical protein